MSRVDSVHQHIIQDETVFIANQSISNLTINQIIDAAGQQLIEQSQGIIPLEGQSSHVRDIEEPRRFAHGLMLIHDSTVLDRHFPAPKLDHPTAVCGMPVKQRCTPQSHSDFLFIIFDMNRPLFGADRFHAALRYCTLR